MHGKTFCLIYFRGEKKSQFSHFFSCIKELKIVVQSKFLLADVSCLNLMRRLSYCEEKSCAHKAMINVIRGILKLFNLFIYIEKWQKENTSIISLAL